MLATRVTPTATPTLAAGRLVRDLVALTKPRVTLMVVLTALGGACLAPEPIGRVRMAATLLAIALLVGSANTLNCYLERDSDRYMARTRNRPLPAGRLQGWVGLMWGLVLAAVALPALMWSSNAITAWLGLLSVTSYVCLYTPLKRRSPWALYVGAVPGALPPLMGYTASHGAIAASGVCAFLLLLVWQIPHFLAIAIFRRSEYAQAGLRSLPVVAGEVVASRHLLASIALLIPVSGLAWWLDVGAAFSGILSMIVAAVWLLYALWSRTRLPTRAWARRSFVSSLLYLSVVIGAIVVNTPT